MLADATGVVDRYFNGLLAQTLSPVAITRLACGNCGQSMRALRLMGHYGRHVEIDYCAPCHLVWFDSVESARLTGGAILELIGAMAHAQSEPHQKLSEEVCCPRCQGPLKLIHNQTRWGPTRQLECLAGHGVWQTFAQFLSEKGFLRSLTAIDRHLLQRQGQHLQCLNCGADLNDGYRSACSYCGCVPALIDLARLARAIDPEGVTAEDAVPHDAHHARPRHHVFNCHACGAAVADELALSCSHCSATQVSTGLLRAYEVLKSLGPSLQEHQRKPAQHILARRMDALNQDTYRRQRWEQSIDEASTRLIDHPSTSHWLNRLLGNRFDPETTRLWESVTAWVLFGALIAWWLGIFR